MQTIIKFLANGGKIHSVTATFRHYNCVGRLAAPSSTVSITADDEATSAYSNGPTQVAAIRCLVSFVFLRDTISLHKMPK